MWRRSRRLGYKALLIEQAENARLSRRLATIQLDSPVAFDAATYHMKPPHQDQLTELLRELEFTTLLKSFQPAFTQAEANAVETELVQDEPSAQRFVEGLPKGGALGLQCLLSPGQVCRRMCRGWRCLRETRPRSFRSTSEPSCGPSRRCCTTPREPRLSMT